MRQPGWRRAGRVTAGRDELVVAAVFDDPAAVQHHDPVGAAYGREPVADENGRQVTGQVEEAVVQIGFGADIQLGRRLVQNEQSGAVLDCGHGPGECDPLPSPAGKVDAARESSRQNRVEPVRQARDDAVRAGAFGGGVHERVEAVAGMLPQ